MSTTTTQDLRRLCAALDHADADAWVLVLGDSMLDRATWGVVERVSPEAPVPVVRLERRSEAPGGAANVAVNLASFGLGVRLLGAVGDDPAGARLRATLEDRGVDCAGLAVLSDRPTTTKQRIFGQQRQLLRIDEESTAPWPAGARRELVEGLEAAIAAGPRAVVISDYAKGCVDEAVARDTIRLARRAGVPVLVDPKRADFTPWAGATLVKPNRAELTRATGLGEPTRPALEAAASELIRSLELEAIVLTLGAEGMSLVQPDGCGAFPATAREVFDVTGAGDTAMATITAGLVLGLSLAQATWLANRASGLAVERLGVAVLERAELRALCEDVDPDRSHEAVADLEQARRAVERWRHAGERVVFTNGCFDLLHPGHLELLQRAAAAGDRLVVGLNSDASVRRLKGPTRPLQGQGDRARLLAALQQVDLVVIFEEDTPLVLIERLRPQVLVKGADYQEHEIVGAEQVRSWGGEVLRVPLLPGHSTTRLANAAERGEP